MVSNRTRSKEKRGPAIACKNRLNSGYIAAACGGSGNLWSAANSLRSRALRAGSSRHFSRPALI